MLRSVKRARLEWAGIENQPQKGSIIERVMIKRGLGESDIRRNDDLGDTIMIEGMAETVAEI